MALSFLMDHTHNLDQKIDEIWEKVNKIDPELMSAWMKCFSGSNGENELKCKQEIKNTVTDSEYQSNPGKNFLLRMMSCNPSLHGYRYLSCCKCNQNRQ